MPTSMSAHTSGEHTAPAQMHTQAALRQLPSVDALLAHAGNLIEQDGHARVVSALRAVLEEARATIRAGGEAPPSQRLIELARIRLANAVDQQYAKLINATGVILHTNLGRAPLSSAAQQALLAVARDYSPLEFDMHTGERGKRGEAIEKLLCEITHAQSALVVNNCAAATVLMLGTAAAGKGVIVSRGQLVEIGGGFRVPDIMRQSGATLIEVGTTNRTKAADYKAQLESSPIPVGAMLRVHSSNFKMLGFVEDVPLEDLVAIGQQGGTNHPSPVPVLDDLGSGALLDTSQFGLAREPMPQDSVHAGVAITCFSGDKLLGGPQAGLMVGQREWIERCRKHPLARAFRADKFTLAALGATLLHYARGEAQRDVPVIRMLAAAKSDIAERAQRVQLALSPSLARSGLGAELIDGESTVGGGSLPGETLPTTLIALSPSGEGYDPVSLQRALRASGTIARVKDGRVLLDLRTVLDDDALVQALVQAIV